SLTISPVKDLDNNIIGLSKIARDITEKKQEERRKNDFIAMVSHELKTPLTSITSYTQLLLAKARKEQDDFEIYALSRSEVQTRKMTSMIQDFLSLAKLEEGKISINKELFELYPIIEEISNDAKFLTPNHTIEFKGCEDIVVEGDKHKIEQVLINLMSNAIKYSQNGGTITIGCERKDSSVRIYISDEGVGINPSDQRNLFSRFYRVRNEKVKNISGFGIGLYLVAEILRYHDSKIELTSEENVGSTFSFILPVHI
ncbi:MAG: PAS domain-containing sensor histidine kinase, partial [Chryseobacterium sp.]